MHVILPKLYAIVDRETLERHGIGTRGFAEELRDAGVRLVQYRDKVGGPQDVLRVAAEIAEVFAGAGVTLILNDRADLAVLAGWDGVHVGQGDLPVADAKRVLGASGLVGISTHNSEQLSESVRDGEEPDYVAVGPVFATSTKLDAEPVVGLEGVRVARGLTQKPLVAIGGISRENARSVIEAGADSVAVIGALLPAEGRSARQRAEELIALLGG